MEKLSKETVWWRGIIPAFESRIQQWRPSNLGGELKFRDDLYAKLCETVPDGCVVQKEYRHFGTTIDIWIKWLGFVKTTELGLELKLNLTKKSEYDRLVGQIEHMEPKKTSIIVVLIGPVDDVFLMNLKHRYATQISNGDIYQTMAIVHVPIKA